MTASGLPNLISVFRILLIAPVVWALLVEHYPLALWLIFAAGLSDAADGLLAKRFGWTSEFGARLDPAADKLLLVACFLVLWWQGLVPWWLFAGVILRDVVIVAGAVVYYFWFERIRAQPSVLSKINTFTQIVCVLLAVFAAAQGDVEPVLLETWFAMTFLTTLFSGIDYVWTWSLRALRVRAGRG